MACQRMRVARDLPKALSLGSKKAPREAGAAQPVILKRPSYRAYCRDRTAKTQIGLHLAQYVVEIRYVKINGLYSYGDEKNRIDFGKKTVVVGVNDSGKSSIFKALNFFLKYLTRDDFELSRPWDTQGIHEMAVGLSLNDEERRYTAEALTVSGDKDRPRLAPDNVVAWLAPRLGRMEITIRWRDRLFQPRSEHAEYFLRLEDLGATAHSARNDYTWVIESSKSSQCGSGSERFPDVVAEMLQEDPAAEDLGGRLGVGAAVSWFPSIVKLDDMEATPYYRSRIELVARVSRYEPQHNSISFFITFGRMLERGFAFVSEQRAFQESNDLEKKPLRSDGSNLQSYLFWLQSGDKDDQDTLFAIRRMFEEVMKQQNLSFVVSVTEKKIQDGDEVGSQIRSYPDRIIVRFVKGSGREQRVLDFMSVGIGVRETLFLLTMCFGRRDGIVLLDEPATNLHPTQIRRLMGRIMSTGDQDTESGQVALITHSPTLASLELLSRTNNIARVSRREYSLVAQLSEEDRKWLEGNLPTFHLLKSDVFFARGVVLVEGISDKLFLEAILDQSSGQGDDVAVVDVGGKKSFEKFRRLLEIFEIPHVILADDDAENLFDSDEVLKIDAEAVPKAKDAAGKKVYLLEKKLEGLLSGLDPDLYGAIKKKYETKPERAYRFVERLFAGDPSDKNKMLDFLMGQISNLGSARQHDDPSSQVGLPMKSTDGT